MVYQRSASKVCGLSLHLMVLFRGTAGSYQAWADAVGDSAYEFENLLPFFKKSVNFTAPNIDVRGGPAIPYQSSAYDPAGGPLHVAYWNDYLEASPYIRSALQEAGFRETDGIESGSLLGFAQWPATVDPDAMVRDSSETSFGRQAIESTTLRFYIGSTAKKIVFSGKKATGVMVETAGITYKLKARKEVVLAAGAVRNRLAPEHRLKADGNDSSVRHNYSWFQASVQRSSSVR